MPAMSGLLHWLRRLLGGEKQSCESVNRLKSPPVAPLVPPKTIEPTASPGPDKPSQITSQGKAVDPARLETLTSRELWAMCRELAYALRVEEAITVYQLARKAHDRERGIDPSATTEQGGIQLVWGFDGSASDLLEPANWAIHRSLQNLTPKEENEILGSLVFGGIRGSSFQESWQEMLLVTVGSNLRWPAFEEWFRRFKEANKWPAMWEIGIDHGEAGSEEIKFYESQLTGPTHPMLARIHGLSLSARRVLLYGSERVTCEMMEMARESFEQASSELIAAGFARPGKELSLVVRLMMLPISKVREIQKKYGVKGARSKEEIAKNLVTAVPEESLAQELPSADFLKVSLDYQYLERFQFERFRAAILAHTLEGMMATYGWVSASNRYSDSPKFEASLTDNCPFCRDAAKRLKNSRRVTHEMLPPFHPGCRCVALPI
jgi:hypothetical protein